MCRKRSFFLALPQSPTRKVTELKKIHVRVLYIRGKTRILCARFAALLCGDTQAMPMERFWLWQVGGCMIPQVADANQCR